MENPTNEQIDISIQKYTNMLTNLKTNRAEDDANNILTDADMRAYDTQINLVAEFIHELKRLK